MDDLLDDPPYELVGFGRRERALTRRLEGDRRQPAEPEVSVHDGAVVVPASRIVRPVMPLHGGVQDASGRFVVASGVRRRGHRPIAGMTDGDVAPGDARDDDREVIFLGWYFNHYGHFLLETLGRAWALPELPADAPVVLANPATVAMRANQARLLELAGVPPERIVHLDGPTRFARVHVPSATYELQHAAHPRFAETFRRISAQVAGDVERGDQPLYLSRTHLPPSQRPIVGEAVLERVLADAGFAVMHPEAESVDDQLRAFAAHRSVVCAIGSAAHNVLFGREGQRWHVLSHDRISPDYVLCTALAGIPSTFVHALSTRGRLAFGASCPMAVDLEAAIDHLAERDLVPGDAEPAAADRDAIEHDYDRAWLQARISRSLQDRETLEPEVADEAWAIEDRAWTLTWVLLRLFARTGDDRADAAAAQLAQQLDAASDADELARWAPIVEGQAPGVLGALGAERAEELRDVLGRVMTIDPRAGRVADEPVDEQAVPDLERIGRRYGTDKSGRGHDYLRTYEEHVGHLRDQEFTLLELGVHMGASLRTWADFFPHAQIVGVDINAPIELGERITVLQGDQGDRAFLASLAQTYRPLVVVDDGSHRWNDQLVSFEVLFPALPPGGVYICEDLHTSFGELRARYAAGSTTNPAERFGALAQSVLGAEFDTAARADPELAAVRDRIRTMTFLKHSLIIRTAG